MPCATRLTGAAAATAAARACLPRGGADTVPYRSPGCPDCQRSLPAVIRAMAERGASLLEVTVGPRPVWKNPAHPFRCDGSAAPGWEAAGRKLSRPCPEPWSDMTSCSGTGAFTAHARSAGAGRGADAIRTRPQGPPQPACAHSKRALGAGVLGLGLRRRADLSILLKFVCTAAPCCLCWQDGSGLEGYGHTHAHAVDGSWAGQARRA